MDTTGRTMLTFFMSFEKLMGKLSHSVNIASSTNCFFKGTFFNNGALALMIISLLFFFFCGGAAETDHDNKMMDVEPYICENGTKKEGGVLASSSNRDKMVCTACNSGYIIIGTLGEAGSICVKEFGGSEISNVGPVGNAAYDFDYHTFLVANGQRIVRDINGVLHAVYYRTDNTTTFRQIIYGRSENNGTSWSNQTIATSVTNLLVLAPSIAINHANPAAVFVVWSQFNDPQGSGETRTYIRLGSSTATSGTTAGTTTFGSPIEISNQLLGYTVPVDFVGSTALDNFVYVDTFGLVHLVWSYAHGFTDHDIYHAVSIGGANWQVTPSVLDALDGDPNSDRHPRITEDNMGQIQLVWMAQRSAIAPNYPNGSQIAFATRTAGPTGTFGAVTTYDPSPIMQNSIYFPDMKYDTTGNRHLTFVEYSSPNYSVRYRQNNDPPQTISKVDRPFKVSMISLTTHDVPVVLFWNSPGTNKKFSSTSKLSATEWTAPRSQSPLNRRNAAMIPVIRQDAGGNDILSAVWFATDNYGTKYAQDTDHIPPYQPAPSGGALQSCSTCVGDNQSVAVTYTGTPSPPADATHAAPFNFHLDTLSGNPVVNRESGFQTASTYTFTGIPDNSTFALTVEVRDAAGNVSVRSVVTNLVIP